MRVLALLLVGAAGLTGQTASFEVASIKPNTSVSGNSSLHFGRGQVRIENYSLRQLVMQAYDLQDYEISAPGWLDDVRFDIVGKGPEGPVAPRLQNLLAERFKLAVHRESRTVTGYVLLVDKKGPKLHESTEAGDGWGRGSGSLKTTGTTMARFARLLSVAVTRPVKDMTGLKGKYDFDLKWATDNGSDDARLPDSLFTALQEQHGLRLEGRKVDIEVVVVDHVEKTPTEN